MGSKKNIPEGWQSYSPLGKQIPGTIIICFKVPLKEEICRNMPQSERFTPASLMTSVPNLAGVIDVTNTPRYYNRQIFLDKGILHEKIQCPGHAVPPANVVDYFQKVMDRMWTSAESAGGKLVGVHCTHGINRTGYLVCRYLIECRGFQPEDAIRLFAESRGHGIERPNYLSDLRTLTPGHHSPHSISHAEFLKKEEERRTYWNTDAQNDSMRPRCDRYRNWRAASISTPPVVHGTPPPPLLSNPHYPPPLYHRREYQHAAGYDPSPPHHLNRYSTQRGLTSGCHHEGRIPNHHRYNHHHTTPELPPSHFHGSVYDSTNWRSPSSSDVHPDCRGSRKYDSHYNSYRH